MSTHNEIWIGLIGLYPLKSNAIIAHNQGAYTNVLLLACDLDDYKIKAKEFLFEMDFEIFDMDDIENLNERMKNYEVDSTIIDLAKIVQKKKIPQITTFHVFDREDL